MDQDLSHMRSLPATVSVDNHGSVLPDALSTADALERCGQVLQKMDALIANDGKDGEIRSAITEVPDILLKCVNRDEAALAVAKKVLQSLYGTSNSACVMWYVATLVAVRDVCKLIVKELTNWVICLDDEQKFNVEIIFSLIHSDLLNVGEYKVHLAELIDGGGSNDATEFAMSLVQTLIAHDSASISELDDVFDVLSEISREPSSPGSLHQFVEIARDNANTPGFAFGKDEKVMQSKDKEVLSSRTNKEENSANETTLADSVASQDQDSSDMISLPATVSVDNHRSVLPDALNIGAALERCGQVMQKVSANLIAVGGCSSKSFSMGILKYLTRLQPSHFRPSTVQRRRPFKELRRKIKKLNGEIFKSDALQKYEERIDLLRQELRKSTDLIFNEQSQLSLIQDVQNITPTSFIDEFDKVISMEKTCRQNDKLLKDLETGLLLNFDHTDSLLSEVKKIHTKNKGVSKDASSLANRAYDYLGRNNVEFSWLTQFVNTTRGFSSRLSAATSDIDDFQKNLSELTNIIDELSSWKRLPEVWDSQLCALRTIFSIWESSYMSIKYSAYLVELAVQLCSLSQNSRGIYREKTDLGERFHRAKLDVEQNGPQLEQSISLLQLEVDRVNSLYVEKLNCIPNDKQRFYVSTHIFQTIHDDLFSWRVRGFNNRNIAPEIKTQGRGECSSVSTTSAAESLYKKKCSARFSIKGKVYQDQEFTIKLSHNHLQDLVAQYIEAKQEKGKNKLDVCLEQMVEKGVLSESAYNDGDAKVEDLHRYRIDGFKEINKAGFHEACDIIEKGNALIGNMLITKDYFRLGPNDIYDIPADAVYETNSAGQKQSHCVVILGFGRAPDGTGYYLFQNSYGIGWGLGGYGRVSAASLKYLYSPILD